MAVPKKQFMDALVRNRFRSNKDIRTLIDNEKRQRRQQRRTVRDRGGYLKGVHNGQFFRIPLPKKRSLLPNLAKLPQTLVKPQPFVSPEAAQAQAATNQAQREQIKDIATLAKEWWGENWAVLVLNLGSICTLIGFTRSDVVELRTLSATGSMASIIYLLSLSPCRYTPIAWSMVFTTVNCWKIYQVKTEREGVVNMTEEEEEIYSHFFMPHGVTPKQFEMISNRAEIVHIKKGTPVVKEGETQEYVCLVTHGETRAQTLGRRLTAASYKVSPSEDVATDNRLSWTSGAWIGEIAFLEKYWKKEQKRKPAEEPSEKEHAVSTLESLVTDVEGPAAATAASPAEPTPPNALNKEEAVSPAKTRRVNSGRRTAALHRSSAMSSQKALYTIVAVQDSTLMRWKHEDMEKLLAQSNDMRGSMTRAMTAAIVGKVINFTVSRRRNSRPNWTSWLRDWTNNAVEIEKSTALVAADFAGDSAESPLGGPIKKFG